MGGGAPRAALREAALVAAQLLAPGFCGGDLFQGALVAADDLGLLLAA